MITFITHLSVKPGNAPALEELLAHVADMVHKHEPDVLYYEFARSVEDPGTIVVIEVYRHAAAQSAHMATPWVRESLPKSMSLIEGPPRIAQYVSPGSEPVRSTIKEMR